LTGFVVEYDFHVLLQVDPDVLNGLLNQRLLYLRARLVQRREVLLTFRASS